MECSLFERSIFWADVFPNNERLWRDSTATRAGSLGLSLLTVYEPPHDKTNKMACAPSEDTDQPGHPPSLNSLRCPHDESLDPWLPIERTAKTLIRSAQSYLSLRWAHMPFCWFCHEAAHM